MEEMTRRTLLGSLAAIGASASIAAATAAQEKSVAASEYENSQTVRQGIKAAAAVADQCQWSEAEKTDRQRM
ncbi:MAG: hypothetical protein ACREBC_36045, partial [Pyrinomonadaceae bacterium]